MTRQLAALVAFLATLFACVTPAAGKTPATHKPDKPATSFTIDIHAGDGDLPEIVCVLTKDEVAAEATDAKAREAAQKALSDLGDAVLQQGGQQNDACAPETRWQDSDHVLCSGTATTSLPRVALLRVEFDAKGVERKIVRAERLGSVISMQVSATSDNAPHWPVLGNNRDHISVASAGGSYQADTPSGVGLDTYVPISLSARCAKRSFALPIDGAADVARAISFRDRTGETVAKRRPRGDVGVLAPRRAVKATICVSTGGGEPRKSDPGDPCDGLPEGFTQTFDLELGVESGSDAVVAKHLEFDLADNCSAPLGVCATPVIAGMSCETPARPPCHYVCDGSTHLPTDVAFSVRRPGAGAVDQWRDKLAVGGQKLASYAEHPLVALDLGRWNPAWTTKAEAGRRVDFVDVYDPEGRSHRLLLDDQASLRIGFPGVGCGDALRYRLGGDRIYREEQSTVSHGAIIIKDPYASARTTFFRASVGAGAFLFPVIVGGRIRSDRSPTDPYAFVRGTIAWDVARSWYLAVSGSYLLHRQPYFPFEAGSIGKDTGRPTLRVLGYLVLMDVGIVWRGESVDIGLGATVGVGDTVLDADSSRVDGLHAVAGGYAELGFWVTHSLELALEGRAFRDRIAAFSTNLRGPVDVTNEAYLSLCGGGRLSVSF